MKTLVLILCLCPLWLQAASPSFQQATQIVQAVTADRPTFTEATNIAKARERRYNVVDYGALPNGVSNCQVEIQAAVDAAQLAGGGTVWLPDGTYILGTTPTYVDAAHQSETHISRFIVWSNNITLEGQSKTGVILRSSGTRANLLNMIGSNNTTNLTLKHLTLDDNHVGRDITQFYYNENLTFEDVHFMGAEEDAVDIQYGGRCTIRGCTFFDIDANVLSDQNTLVNMYDCYAETTVEGVAIEPFGGIVNVYNSTFNKCPVFFMPHSGAQAAFYGCLFQRTNTAGTNIFGPVLLDTCTFTGSGTAVWVDCGTAGSTVINNCYITSGSVSANAGSTLIYTGNRSVSLEPQIRSSGGAVLRITGNKMSGNGGNSVRLEGGATDNAVIANNTFTDNPIYSDNTGTNTMIMGNQFMNGVAISFWKGDKARITGNQFVNDSCTVTLWTSSVGNVLVNNTFRTVTLNSSGANYYINNLINATNGTTPAPAVFVGNLKYDSTAFP